MSCGYHVFNPGIVGANIYPLCINSTSQILMVCPGDNNGNCFQIETYGLPGGFVTFRLQHLPSSLTDVCQAWDVNGNQIANATVSYSKEFAYANGVSVGDGNGAGYVINYARIYAATVGVNSRPPVTADTTAGLVFEWKFDGNLNDSGPGGYTGVLTSGSASYVTTLGSPWQCRWWRMRMLARHGPRRSRVPAKYARGAASKPFMRQQLFTIG